MLQEAKTLKEAKVALGKIAVEIDRLKKEYPQSVLARSGALQGIAFKARVFAGIEKP